MREYFEFIILVARRDEVRHLPAYRLEQIEILRHFFGSSCFPEYASAYGLKAAAE